MCADSLLCRSDSHTSASMVRKQAMAEPQQQPLASPLKGFHIPAGTKMPQTQADLAVYVKSLLAQMVRSSKTA